MTNVSLAGLDQAWFDGLDRHQLLQLEDMARTRMLQLPQPEIQRTSFEEFIAISEGIRAQLDAERNNPDIFPEYRLVTLAIIADPEETKRVLDRLGIK